MASGNYSSAVNARGREKNGAAGYCPKLLLPKRAKMVLCSFHRSHREICTRNRPLSETKFLLMISGGAFLSQPLWFTAERRVNFGMLSKFVTDVAKRYGEGSEIIGFSRQTRQENRVQTVKNCGGSKILRLVRKGPFG